MNIATATAFTTINARSFHLIETHNQPAHPRNCRNIFQGYKSFVVAIIARTIMIDDTHLTYHTSSWCSFRGVCVLVSCDN
jgi:hypothetical protein